MLKPFERIFIDRIYKKYFYKVKFGHEKDTIMPFDKDIEAFVLSMKNRNDS